MCSWFPGSYPCKYDSQSQNCIEINSCEKEKDTTLCSKFEYCEPGETACRTNKCMDITSIEECKLKTFDKRTTIKCKRENNDCIQDEEITTCEQAKDLNEISNEQCLILATSTESNLYLKDQMGVKK